MVRLLALCSFLLPVLVLAHPGGLDANGCHNDRKHSGYHCHGSPPSPPSRPSSSAPPVKSSVTWEARRPAPPDGGVPKAAPTPAPQSRRAADKASAESKASPITSPASASAPAGGTGTAEDGQALLCFIVSIIGLPVVVYVLIRRALRPPGVPLAETGDDASSEESAERADKQVRRRREPPRHGERGLTANRKGKCTECGRWFGAGAPIFWNASTRRARHVRCDEA